VPAERAAGRVQHEAEPDRRPKRLRHVAGYRDAFSGRLDAGVRAARVHEHLAGDLSRGGADAVADADALGSSRHTDRYPDEQRPDDQRRPDQ